TAEPKLVPYSHALLLAAAERVQRWYNLGGADSCLSVTPVHYCHGLTLTVFAPLISGGQVVFPEDPSRPNLDEWFCRLRPTWYSAGPTLHLAILEKLSTLADPGEHRLRFAVSGGASLPSTVQTGLEACLGVPLLNHYGATEAMQIASNRVDPKYAKRGTCGMPDHGSLKVVDASGTEVPPGKIGEILVGGPTVVPGYLNAPGLNEHVFVKGWYR